MMDEQNCKGNLHDHMSHFTWNELSDHFDTHREFRPQWVSLKIAFIYIILGVLWILFTDQIVNTLVKDKHTVEMLSMIKGWFYVVATGVLIYLLIFFDMKKMTSLEQELIAKYQQLSIAHEDIESAYEEITATEDELRKQNLQLELNQKKLTESELKLKNLAYVDLLTGLPNKMYLETTLNSSVEEGSIRKCALIHIDSDNLKYINDTLGHSFGDLLIHHLASRLKVFENGECTLFRKGSDEFVILLSEYETLDQVTDFANEVLNSIRRPFQIKDSVFRITTSIGISTYPENASNIKELLKCSAIALLKAKRTGKNKCSFYDQVMHKEVMERIRIERFLYTALEYNEFILYYQPQVDIRTGKISGFEALLRWNNPELGFVSPEKFITIAEETHLIISIGKWVLEKACEFIQTLQKQGIDHFFVSVNVSTVQLMYSNFADTVFNTLEQFNIEPKFLELEITESILMESVDTIIQQLRHLRDSGIDIALDDFGKGYSSLTYLKQLPISTLKIDRGFLEDFSQQEGDKDLLGPIITIANNMGLNVVAEGVETKEQLAFLKEKQCPRIQGYLFSKPVPAEEAVKQVQENKGFGFHV